MNELAAHILRLNEDVVRSRSYEDRYEITDGDYDTCKVPYKYRAIISDLKDWDRAVKWAEDVQQGLY